MSIHVIILLLVSDGLKAWIGLFPDNPIVRCFAAEVVMAVFLISLLLAYRHILQIRESHKLGKKTWKVIRKHCYLRCAVILLLSFLLFLTLSAYSLESIMKRMPPLLPYMLMMLAICVLVHSIEYFILIRCSEPFPDSKLADWINEILCQNNVTHCEVRLHKIESNDRMNGCYMRFFHKRLIVLYFNPDEEPDEDYILSIMAHEACHCIYNHERVSYIYIMILFALDVLLKAATEYLAPTEENEMFLMVLSLLLVCVFVPLLHSSLLKAKRRREYIADAFAVEQGYAEASINQLRDSKIYGTTFLNPHPLLVKLTYTHPPLSQRIAAIEKKKKESESLFCIVKE